MNEPFSLCGEPEISLILPHFVRQPRFLWRLRFITSCTWTHRKQNSLTNDGLGFDATMPVSAIA